MLSILFGSMSTSLLHWFTFQLLHLWIWQRRTNSWGTFKMPHISKRTRQSKCWPLGEGLEELHHICAHLKQCFPAVSSCFPSSGIFLVYPPTLYPPSSSSTTTTTIPSFFTSTLAGKFTFWFSKPPCSLSNVAWQHQTLCRTEPSWDSSVVGG